MMRESEDDGDAEGNICWTGSSYAKGKERLEVIHLLLPS